MMTDGGTIDSAKREGFVSLQSTASLTASVLADAQPSSKADFTVVKT